MSKAKSISWRQIAVEATAIVASILLAFAIDAWWDEQKDLKEEREILLGLKIEFVDLRDRLDYWVEQNRKGIGFIEQFLSDSVDQMDLNGVESAFLYASMVNVLDQGGAVDALLASGRLEKIADRDIRSHILKWPDWLDDIHTNDLSARSYSLQTIVPVLTRNGFPRTACPKESIYVCSGSEPAPASLTRLADDAEFRAMLINRRVWMQVAVRDHEMALGKANEILEMIDKRLANLPY